MEKIINIQELRAREVEKLMKRKTDLELLVNVSDITYKTVLGVEDSERFMFSSMINTYLTRWKKELERIKFKLGIK